MHVVNTDSGLAYKYAVIYDSNGDKVDELCFHSRYIGTQDLTVTKVTSGAYANKSHAFPFTVTVSLPLWSELEAVSYISNGTQGTAAVTETIAQSEGCSEGCDDSPVVTARTATITASLADLQSLVLSGLPVGTTYAVSETDSSDGVGSYTPSASYTFSSDSQKEGLTTASHDVAAVSCVAGIVISESGNTPNASTMVGDADGNSVTVTNTLDDPPSPTGIAITMLPYVVLVAISAGLLAMLYMSRKRLRQES